MNYLPNEVKIQFGGDVSKGTFSDLVGAYPTQVILSSEGPELQIDAVNSIVQFYELRHTVSIGALLSLIPEMGEFFNMATGEPSRAHPLTISQKNDRTSVLWEFRIGNGERRPNIEEIENAFPNFNVTESFGRVVVSVPAERMRHVRAMIYTDTRGKLWFVENPFFPVVLPEFCVHFLISFAFSNVMRYRPDEWGALINNDVDSQISLLSRHYFSVLERKFLPLVLRSLSKYFPYAIS